LTTFASLLNKARENKHSEQQNLTCLGSERLHKEQMSQPQVSTHSRRIYHYIHPHQSAFNLF